MMYVLTPSSATELDHLLALWERSVRATHHFLAEEDIDFYRPMVREFLESGMLTLWTVRKKKPGALPLGFMGMDIQPDGAAATIDALFLDPDAFRLGLGSRCVRFAQECCPALTLDVNEGNPGAEAFYRRMGFVETGRSPLDGAGKPFPLIHMRWERAASPS